MIMSFKRAVQDDWSEEFIDIASYSEFRGRQF